MLCKQVLQTSKMVAGGRVNLRIRDCERSELPSSGRAANPGRVASSVPGFQPEWDPPGSPPPEDVERVGHDELRTDELLRFPAIEKSEPTVAIIIVAFYRIESCLSQFQFQFLLQSKSMVSTPSRTQEAK